MFLQYKNKIYQLDSAPPSLPFLLRKVKTIFKISNPVILIKQSRGITKISSSSQFDMVNWGKVHEIYINDMIDSLEDPSNNLSLNKLDSIETCTSHEKTDSEAESTLMVSANCGQTLDCISESMETEEITYASIAVGPNGKEFADFSCQYDAPLIIELREMEEAIRREAFQFKQKFFSQIGMVHKDIKCNHCNVPSIVGVRYECLTCKISFCDRCEEDAKHPHDMIKHKIKKNVIGDSETREMIVKKVMDLGFGDHGLVAGVAKNKDYNLNKIVEALLFTSG